MGSFFIRKFYYHSLKQLVSNYGIPIAIVGEKTKMDREIPQSVLNENKKKLIMRVIVVITIIVLVIISVLYLIKPRVSSSDLLLCTATKGSVESSFVTSGIVESYYQELLVSAISAKIISINYRPGDLVSINDTIVVQNIDKLADQSNELKNKILLEKNRIQKSTYELESKFAQLENNLITDSIKITQLKSQLEREVYLESIGGGSLQKIEQAETELQLAKITRKNLINEFESFKKLQRLDIESMSLELSLQKGEKAKIDRQISKAYIRPNIPGVITSLLVEPGQFISEGEAVAHVADPERFKIEGVVSTRYADQVFPGQEAMVLVNDSVIHGTVVAISPSVNGGTINYTVNLIEPSSKILRAKLQVEVRLLKSKVDNTVRICNGDYYYGPGNTEIFVKNGHLLEKRNVKLGGANFDYVQVISGIENGEQVVINNSFIKSHLRYNTLTCSE